MKKQNKIKISKKLIVNIKYDLVQCKQINIACRIHLLNRKKRVLFNICNNNFQLAGSFNNTKFQCTSRVVFLWWLKQFINKWRPLSQKAYQKSAYISQKDRQKNHAGFLADNGNLLQIWMWNTVWFNDLLLIPIIHFKWCDFLR